MRALSWSGVRGVWLPPKWILFISAGFSFMAVMFLGSGIFFMSRKIFKYSQYVVDEQYGKDVGGDKGEEVGRESECVAQPSSAKIAEK